jgi:hypothetical protein
MDSASGSHSWHREKAPGMLASLAPARSATSIQSSVVGRVGLNDEVANLLHTCSRSSSHQSSRGCVPSILDDDEYAELQRYMVQNPEAGELVRGSGGVRKLRWVRPGMGKRGGLRVIYFVRYEPNEFWMLSLYAKAKQKNVPGHILKQVLEAFRNG